MRQILICTPCISNYYLCDFLNIYIIIKLEECDRTDDDVYILNVKRYIIRTSGLGRCYNI
jgi:hypothetical protein